jgi:hypothetical protein
MAEEPIKKKAWYEIISILTPFIIGICVTGLGTYFTQVYNFRQLQINQLNLLDKFRESLVSEDADKRIFAYESFVILGYESLAVKMIVIKKDSAGRSVIQEIKSNGTATTKAEATAILPTLPIQVYIQIASESQRVKANEITTQLQQKGFVMPGIENMAGKGADMPKNTNVRYFNDEDKPTAEAIVAIPVVNENSVKLDYPHPQ